MFFFICALTMLGVVSWRAWKRLQQWRSSLENLMNGMEREIYGVQVQLADHYDYAAMLNERLDAASESNDATTARIAIFEEETTETLGSLQEEISCVRYGLMEYGGFVRCEALTREQRAHMLTQERGNFVLWNMRTRAQTTDSPVGAAGGDNNGDEGAEEESSTHDS